MIKEHLVQIILLMYHLGRELSLIHVCVFFVSIVHTEGSVYSE